MREMIISELTQALHELARGFAHYLPRLIVMLILAFVGWVIAYVVKVVLRSILGLIKFDKLSENAGAAQLLTKVRPRRSRAARRVVCHAGGWRNPPSTPGEGAPSWRAVRAGRRLRAVRSAPHWAV